MTLPCLGHIPCNSCQTDEMLYLYKRCTICIYLILSLFLVLSITLNDGTSQMILLTIRMATIRIFFCCVTSITPSFVLCSHASVKSLLLHTQQCFSMTDLEVM